MKTAMVKTGQANPRWLLVDATDQVLGRLAAKVAMVLMGKHRPTYTPHVDTGDFVVVVNAAKIRVTGRKREQENHQWYTGYPGGQRERSLGEMLDTRPDEVIQLAVRRMLPKSKLGRSMFTKLKVYAGTEHPHGAQRPEVFDVAAKSSARR
ncbi:MAG: 50S ribosomal protein L13 [Planctomycetes bacterium]|nr:50S ribosomal protein L13 [Planctomycetota bacterium]MBI3844593.1 50S ribosomal protein L13 [Planctomycetota bacterium]